MIHIIRPLFLHEDGGLVHTQVMDSLRMQACAPIHVFASQFWGYVFGTSKTRQWRTSYLTLMPSLTDLFLPSFPSLPSMAHFKAAVLMVGSSGSRGMARTWVNISPCSLSIRIPRHCVYTCVSNGTYERKYRIQLVLSTPRSRAEWWSVRWCTGRKRGYLTCSAVIPSFFSFGILLGEGRIRSAPSHHLHRPPARGSVKNIIRYYIQ